MLETEKKIVLDPKDMDTVFDAMAPKGFHHKHHPRAYYDTPDLKLNSERVAVRLQDAGQGRSKQTIKAARDNIGDTLVRAEWDMEVSGTHPDFSVIEDVEILNALHGVVPDDLVHIFTSDVKRRYFDLACDGGIVEMAFDRGVISLADGSASVEFCEIEVELKSGPPHLVDQVADEVLKMAKGASVSTVSKAERGMRLYQAARKTAE
tara:strand:+ start:2250 stop:2870 length:621 start_codon:yes stop_codon:yes gene_type:complete